MSIKFICSCGKHLRARDEMAARRSRCPRCGEPVGIPSLHPTHAGTMAAPLTPQERRRRNRLAGHSDEDAAAVTTTLPPQPPPGLANAAPEAPERPPRRLRLALQMESHWYQCLEYPLLCGRLLAAMTCAMTVLTGCLVMLAPLMPHFGSMTAAEWTPYAACLLPLWLVLVYVAGTVECALTSALAGRGPGPYWPGRFVDGALRSAGRWLVCFAAGPVVPAVLAVCYWLYGGDLTGLDWLILGELVVLAVAYWLLAVVASAESGRLRDANPVRVARLARRLGRRAVVPVVVAPALVLAHIFLGFFALASMHKHTSGWLVLAFCWGSGLFMAMFLFRLLGVWCYRKV